MPKQAEQILMVRFRKALLLLAVFALMIVTPLAPLAGGAIPHGAEECSGDCATCGCAPERSADRTCCCWTKKLHGSHDREQDQVPECCQKEQSPRETVLRCGCPCGGDKIIAVSGEETLMLLPHRLTLHDLVNHIPDTIRHHCAMERHGDPPDPPPKA